MSYLQLDRVSLDTSMYIHYTAGSGRLKLETESLIVATICEREGDECW
jgi:hypothetical protein